MDYYYDKGTGQEYEAIQWTGKNIDQITAFVRKGTVTHNAITRELTITNPLWDHLRYRQSVGLRDWIIRSGDRIDVCTNFLFTQSFIHLADSAEHKASPQPELPKEEPMPAQPPSSVVRRYCNKVVSEAVEAMQYNSDADRDTFLAFTQGLRNIGYRVFKSGDWIVKYDNERFFACPNDIFVDNYNPLPKEETVAAQLISQDPFEPMRQVIDLDSYEYLNEAYPFYIQAIEHALTAGKTPTDIGKFVIENTSSRRDIGLLCEQAARHIQRKGQAA